MKDFNLILIDPNPALCKAWRSQFKGLSSIKIVNDHFENLTEYDCMVSAANSFGLMDGGVDLGIISHFGLELMDKVQAIILEEYLGEQPVGTCFVVETGHPYHPFLAHTPTMRVPMAIATTDNVYCAMWAMLLAVYKHNQKEAKKIRSVACPGLGTGVGRVDVEEAARQMNLAYRWFINPLPMINWPGAQARQSAIGRGGDSK